MDAGKFLERQDVAVGFVVVAVVFLAVFLFSLSDISAFFKSLVDQYGILGVFIVSLLSSATVLLPAPGNIAVFVAGAAADHSLLFNPFAIGIAAGIGATLGELVSFAIGWELDVKLLQKRHGHLYKQAAGYFREYGFFGIFIFAFFPLPFDVMGLLAGALHYSPVKYFLATLAGKIPKMTLIAFAGFAGAEIVLKLFNFGS
jgi:membrane protein DedA with SNARE-associated domain